MSRSCLSSRWISLRVSGWAAICSRRFASASTTAVSRAVSSRRSSSSRCRLTAQTLTITTTAARLAAGRTRATDRRQRRPRLGFWRAAVKTRSRNAGVGRRGGAASAISSAISRKRSTSSAASGSDRISRSTSRNVGCTQCAEGIGREQCLTFLRSHRFPLVAARRCRSAPPRSLRMPSRTRVLIVPSGSPVRSAISVCVSPPK